VTLTDIKFGYVKVKHPSVKKPVYLEQAKIVTKGEYTFVTGYEVYKDCEPKIVKGGGVMHLLQLGEGVEIIEQTVNKMYCELEDTDPKRGITILDLGTRGIQ
jgi:hypothetical protein